MNEKTKTGLQEKIHQPMRASAKPKRGNWFERSVIAGAASPVEGNFVPVSFVAKDWNVTPRRIRSLLAAERLEGRREANGYWEVALPLPLHHRDAWAGVKASIQAQAWSTKGRN